MEPLTPVLQELDRRFERTVEDLVELARIPGISAPGFDTREVERSAEQVARLLSEAGLAHVGLLRFPGGHPYVVGDWLEAGEGRPTLLLYAHHDVQPPGRLERWRTPAFEPTLRPDGRLYGRGVADDKAGLLAQLAAIQAWLSSRGSLPVNLKLLVDGEEEIGSPNLGQCLDRDRERLAADVIVLSDTANLETGLPSLTTSLRGLVAVDVTVSMLRHPVHSGMWGGPVMDAAAALCCLLARLVDPGGRIAIPGVHDDVPEVTRAERERLAALPFDSEAFRSQAGLVPGGRLAGDPGQPVYERLWLRPSLAVTALEGVPLAAAANQLIDVARARVGIRLAPGQGPERVCRLLVDALGADPPFGAEVRTQVQAAVPGWRIQARGPAFDAARRALSAAFGREPVEIGCGGTIPFAGPFSEAMHGAPTLMLGLEDPACNAHGENESLGLEDFRKACHAITHLLQELSGLRPLAGAGRAARRSRERMKP